MIKYLELSNSLRQKVEGAGGRENGELVFKELAFGKTKKTTGVVWCDGCTIV